MGNPAGEERQEREEGEREGVGKGRGPWAAHSHLTLFPRARSLRPGSNPGAGRGASAPAAALHPPRRGSTGCRPAHPHLLHHILCGNPAPQPWPLSAGGHSRPGFCACGLNTHPPSMGTWSWAWVLGCCLLQDKVRGHCPRLYSRQAPNVPSWLGRGQGFCRHTWAHLGTVQRKRPHPREAQAACLAPPWGLMWEPPYAWSLPWGPGAFSAGGPAQRPHQTPPQIRWRLVPGGPAGPCWTLGLQ